MTLRTARKIAWSTYALYLGVAALVTPGLWKWAAETGHLGRVAMLWGFPLLVLAIVLIVRRQLGELADQGLDDDLPNSQTHGLLLNGVVVAAFLGWIFEEGGFGALTRVIYVLLSAALLAFAFIVNTPSRELLPQKPVDGGLTEWWRLGWITLGGLALGLALLGGDPSRSLMFAFVILVIAPGGFWGREQKATQ